MGSKNSAGKGSRTPLSRKLILEAAVFIADNEDILAVTMRRLGQQLGVEAMSLYHHVANREELLDGMVDQVFEEIKRPIVGTDWKTAMRDRANSVRATLTRHPWATPLLDSRTVSGPATLQHHESVIGNLRQAGFSLAMAAHAFSLLDSYIYGFALQESSLPYDNPEQAAVMAKQMIEQFPREKYPYLAELTLEHVMQPGYDFTDEFAFGLELILNGLDALHTSIRS